MKTMLSSRRYRYVARVSIFLISVALITGMVGCVPARYNLTVSSTEGGKVITPGEGAFTYYEGEVVDLVAKADEGYRLTNWTGDVDTIADVNDATTTIIVDSHYSITANFAAELIQIQDWYDLDAIRSNLSGNYILMNDLDSATAGYAELASPTANGGKGWQPIGSLSVAPFSWYPVDPFDPFIGTLDGQGYEIRNLFIDRPDEDGAGLFGCVGRGGVAENLGVVNAEVTGRSYVGALVGGNWGTASNSYLTGSVIGNEHTGGLMGGNWGTVWNSYTTGSVTGDQHTGGLVGGNSGTVSDCYSRSNVTGGGDVNKGGVGGLVGGNWGTVWNSYSTGSVAGDLEVGGLLGWQHDGTVSKSYATGSVTGSVRVGGLVGGNRGTVGNCYSTGNVTGYSDVGGLVGWNEDAVNNSYSAGSVTGHDHVGGLIGKNENDDTVSNCFWDIQTSGQATSDGGTGKTTAEMQDIATFSGAGWNIIAVASGERNPAYIWNIAEGQTYPFLSWQS